MSAEGLLLSCFLLSIVSALIPWVNGEVLLLTFSAFSDSPAHRAGLVLMATAGQMTGKCLLYWAGRGVIPMKEGRLARVLHAWKGRFERDSTKTMALVFVSAVFGIPPFYVITLLSGAFRIRFSRFIVVGACGRVLHFGTLMLVPQIGRGFLQAIAHH
jgi:membrane protein YqaA with SNARE-associated domain